MAKRQREEGWAPSLMARPRSLSVEHVLVSRNAGPSGEDLVLRGADRNLPQSFRPTGLTQVRGEVGQLGSKVHLRRWYSALANLK